MVSTYPSASFKLSALTSFGAETDALRSSSSTLSAFPASYAALVIHGKSLVVPELDSGLTDEEPESDSGIKEETADGWDWGIGCWMNTMAKP